MNEVSIVIFMVIAGFLWAVAAYSVGHKEGERKGYARGRAVNRHAVTQNFYTPPADIEMINP